MKSFYKKRYQCTFLKPPKDAQNRVIKMNINWPCFEQILKFYSLTK